MQEQMVVSSKVTLGHPFPLNMAVAMVESKSADDSKPEPPIQTILESDLDNDRETLEALKVLSDWLDMNTLQARRNLNSDIEKRSLTLDEELLGCV